jgi:hypothetical protein
MLVAVASRNGVAVERSSVGVSNICNTGVGLERRTMVGMSRGTCTSGVGLDEMSTGVSTSGMVVGIGGTAVASLKSGMSQPTSIKTERIIEMKSEKCLE